MGVRVARRLLCSPEVGLEHAVQVLVKGPGGVVAAPVVVLTVGVGEEVAAQHGEVGRPCAGGHVFGFVHGIEVVRQGPELGLP